MNIRKRETRVGSGPKWHDGLEASTGAVRAALLRASTFILIAATPFVVWSCAHAQVSNSAGSPIVGLMPVGTPVEIVSGLSIPWSAVPVGEEVLVSQRGTAEIVAFRPGEALQSVGTVPDFVARGDGGMLGLAVLEQGRDDVWIYAYHSTTRGNRIVRMPYNDGMLGEAQTIFDGIPGGRSHNGGRIAFGPDGMLYATIGENRNLDLPQDLNSLGGKILRMTPDGGIPGDNPFPDSLVYSYGHRNPQGLAWDDAGQLWATEFGDDCAFRGSWAVISRDLGHAFHGIAGSHFMPSGRLANR